MKKIILLIGVAAITFAACKKDNNSGADIPTDTTTCYDIPIVVEDSTAEFNVLFYGDFCVNCPYAHFNLFVDGVFMGRLYDVCYEEGDCRCDSNANGMRTIIAPGVHTYKAIPYCGWLENGEVVDQSPANWCIEETFEVPADNCISIYVSKK